MERHDPFFAAFPQHPHHAPGEVQVVEIQPHQLAQAQARRIKQFENRFVASAERRADVGRLEQLRHFPDTKMIGNPDFTLGRPDQRGGISLEHAFPPEVPAKRANRRQLARGRSFRRAAPRQVAEKRARAGVIEVPRRQG